MAKFTDKKAAAKPRASVQAKHLGRHETDGAPPEPIAPGFDSSAQARTNVTYELHTLGWPQFQDLCAAVLRTTLGQEIETFSKTNDGGQDGTFCGQWDPKKGGVAGTGTLQCKFSAIRDSKLTFGQLGDELTKARRLAREGRAKTYILVTNCSVTQKSRNAIESKFRSIPGIATFSLYGSQWLNEQITNNDELRMLVPRVYGLGDLTQILDQRRRDQARAILSSNANNITTFVMTKAYYDSVRAINETGFVMLLGDPATGKTSIATALALGSIDRWKCVPTKVTKGQEFRDAWNANERQFFWVDDAFGPMQYQSADAADWVRTFPYIQTALKIGAKIVFTSRTYIFRRALSELKTSEFPIIRDSKVLIDVEKYGPLERKGILYNHLRLGDQPEAFRKTLADGGQLDLVAEHKRFTPVVARRLSAPMYTKKLRATAEGLDHFIENQGDYIREMIREFDAPSRAGLSLIFMSGGSLKAPLSREPRYQHTAERFDTSIPEIATALNSMDGSVVRKISDGTEFQWIFDHPSIGDALASILSSDIEQLDIYLQGTKPERIAQEVTCIGQRRQGAVQVPASQYDLLLKRLWHLSRSWSGMQQLQTFLFERADRKFLEAFLSRDPELPRRLAAEAGYSFTVESRLLARLHQFKLVPEEDRVAAIASITKRAVETLDMDFTKNSLASLLTGEEKIGVLNAIRDEGLPNLDDIIDDVENEYESPADPTEHFSELVSNLEELKESFEDDPAAVKAIDGALEEIENRVEQLAEELPPEQQNEDDRDDELDDESSASSDESSNERDYFSDVYVPI